ncbi:MAG TPA: condensation domain-containing protein, partial [Rhodothermales bacterium]|nr:condensation domain-containing protein [Rhodothermales bacterium]
LWFIDQLEPGLSAYNIPLPIRIRGALDLGILERCINEIRRRHEVLRTTFQTVDGSPVQIISEFEPITLEVVELGHLPEAEGEAQARVMAAEEARQPFVLSEGELMRVKVLRLSEQHHWVLCTMHHIISDGWSMGVLVNELSALYLAYSQGRPSPLPELPVQYADFAQWQRERLSGEALEAQLDYWKQQLAGIRSTLDLPTDRPRPALQTFAGATQQFKLREGVTEGLRALSQRENTTLFMTLLAAFQTLLARYTQQDDIVVGTPIAGRNRSEIEGLVGFFANTLALRGNLSGDPTFRELMERTSEVALGAYAHQEVPFERLVEELQPERDLSRNPLFQVMFAVQNAPGGDLDLKGLTLYRVELGSRTTRFDVECHMWERGEALSGFFIYNTDLFDEATIRRMVEHFQNLLEAIVANPDERIQSLPLMSEEEKHQLLVEWNDTAVAYPSGQCVHQLFEAQVARTPDAVAVLHGAQQLTYRELNARANQLAHLLLAGGLAPDSVVAVCLERSPDMLVAVAAVLKAGAAYLPLDPGYPHERLAFMLEDTGAPFLLTQESLREQLPPSSAAVLRLDSDAHLLDARPAHDPAVAVSPDNLAYVIYTSGSTGRPKGVMVSHSNVTRLFAATDSWFHFDSRDVWTLFHSYAFDFSVWEMWGALLYGGRLVVVPYIVSRTPEKFYRLLCQEGVTVLNQTPSAFRLLSQAAEAVNLHDDRLRLVIFGGEALELESLRPWMTERGDERPQMINMYGITETT